MSMERKKRETQKERERRVYLKKVIIYREQR